jgi:hypothetical protein
MVNSSDDDSSEQSSCDEHTDVCNKKYRSKGKKKKKIVEKQKVSFI